MGLQRGLIELEVEHTQLQRIELKLKNCREKAPIVLKNAVNAAARDAKRELAEKAKETYAVKAPRFKKAIAQKNATKSKPVATLRITGKSNALSDFKYKVHSGSAGAKGKLYNSSIMKDLSLHDKLKAFVVKFKSGHVAVVRRDPPLLYTRGLAERKKKGGDRTKIKEFYSPSIPRMVGNEAKVYGIIKPNIHKNLQKNIQKQVDKILRGE